MPYIPGGARAKAFDALYEYTNNNDSSKIQELSDGELNFLVSILVDEWIGPKLSYGRLSDAIKTLECAKLEMYLRLVGPYEDHKASQNGPVYQDR